MASELDLTVDCLYVLYLGNMITRIVRETDPEASDEAPLEYLQEQIPIP